VRTNQAVSLPLSPQEEFVAKMGEVILKRSSSNKLEEIERLERAGGTNREVEGMFSPTKDLLKKNVWTRMGVIEAQVTLSSYSTEEVLRMRQEVSIPQEVLRRLVEEAGENPLPEIRKGKLRELEEGAEESKKKRARMEGRLSLQEVEKALRIPAPPKGTWSRERSLSCLEKMGVKGRKGGKAKELEGQVLAEWRKYVEKGRRGEIVIVEEPDE